MKISEFKGANAIEFIGDIIEPAATIFSDEVVRGLFTPEKNGEKKNKAAIAKHICKEYSTEVIEILAAMNEVSPEEYSGNPITVLTQVFEILNDPDLMSVFISSEQKTASTSFGSASTNSEDEISKLSPDTLKADT